jgi:uncharacterized membrane protein YgcG
MRTETFQLPDETYDEFQARQRELRRRRDSEASIPAVSSFDPLPSFNTTRFDTGRSSDTSASTDSFSGGGGDFGGGGASDSY